MACLVGVTVVLTGAFVTSSLLVAQHAAQLDGRAAEIVENAAPSITELAAARTELRHLELGVGRYLGATLAHMPSRRTPLDGWRGAADAHLGAYERMPYFPDARELTLQLTHAKARVYDDVDRAVAAIDGGRFDAARAIILGPLDRDAEELDRLTERLIVLNNEHAAASAREMTAVRRHNRNLSLGLDAVSVLLGGVLLFAAVRAGRLYHRALDERRRVAEVRASELDQFAARVAHDLKAPLATLLLGSAVAAEYPEQTTRSLVKIQRTSRLMSDMIDALLAVARVEPERGRTGVTTVASVLDLVVDEARPTAETAQASLRVEPFGETVAVACSAGVLASVLSNLLQNAVKYISGAAGERIVIVRVLERGVCVRFEVSDTGPGLPPDIEARVFDRYVKGKESVGLGLGLATVKRLVEMSGGRLGVSSSPEKGSCFWTELPRATAVVRAAG